MDFLTDRLSAQYGSFPEPVIVLYTGQIVYSNEAGQALLQREDFPQDLLPALAEHPGAMEIALGQTFYFVTVSPLPEGDLLVLRDLDPPEEKKHPFSNAVYRMRECLSNFSATQWKMQQVLEANGLLDGLEQDLANQNRLVFQMLRLTRQAELTQELNNKSFPREEGFDLAMVCQGMADEATWLADLAGVRFSYSSNVDHLPFKASKSLLTQMLLALVSNGVRAAGKGGEVELKLHADQRSLGDHLVLGGTGRPDGTAHLDLSGPPQVVDVFQDDRFLLQNAVGVGLHQLGLDPLPGKGPHQGHRHQGHNDEQGDLHRQSSPQPSGDEGHQAARAEPDGNQSSRDAFHTGKHDQQDQPYSLHTQKSLPPFSRIQKYTKLPSHLTIVLYHTSHRPGNQNFQGEPVKFSCFRHLCPLVR